VKRAITKHLGDFSAIIVLGVIAGAVAAYILSNQRLRFPIVEPTPKKLKFEFSTAQAVTPGQGQTVRVSGVRIGDIAKTELKQGRAIITVDIDDKYKSLVHTDATAMLRPKTGLKDMFIELKPGSESAAVATENHLIPISNTLPDVNPDEVLAALDGDARDYLKLLVSGAGEGLKGRGDDLREVFRRFEPTHRDLARVQSAVAKRHTNLRRLIHSLNQLNGELATKDKDLARLVESSAAVFRAFASEQANVTEAVEELPGALRQTTSTLRRVQSLAEVLGPTAEKLRPAVRKLDDANRALIPLAREGTPILRSQIRPFVRNARPLVRSLRPASRNLATSTPDLTRTFVVLNHLFNMLGFNQDGREAPDVQGRDEGYLFWLAWLSHNGAALFSSSDANGPFRPVTLGAPCAVLKQMAEREPALNMVLSPSLLDPAICG
jgi:phospholipid/cholesterol/gamma-HCH transport system substrate-binding protein